MRLPRVYLIAIAVICSLLFLSALHIALTRTNNEGLAATLLGFQAEKQLVTSGESGTTTTTVGGGGALPYPFSIQNIMWVIFFITLGELLYRHQEAGVAKRYLDKAYLPGDDDNVVLQPGELTPIFAKVKQAVSDKAALLPRLVHQTIIQFENSHSIEQAANLLNSNLELLSHELELRYNILRYLVWLIPTLGFVGTIYGISDALTQVSKPGVPEDQLLNVATGGLSIAFDTTLLALLQSAVLVYLLHIIQEKEETVLNLSGKDCLNNLINRLYVHRGE